MHTKRAVRSLTSIVAVSAAVFGSMTTLATSAAAAGSETITASAEQARYAVGQTAVLDVVVTNATVGDPLSISVSSGPDHTSPSGSCTNIDSNGHATCSLTNTGGAGTDEAIVTDTSLNVSSSATPVNFESISASASPRRTQAGAHAEGDVKVTVSSTTSSPTIKEVLTSGSNSSAGSCSGSGTSWTCTVFNDGRTDAATLEVYDDVNANNSPDSGEPSATATVYFEQVTATLDQSGTQSTHATVTITATADGVPSGQSPNFDYQVITGPDAGGVQNCGTGNPATCTLTNDGTEGTDDIRVFDDVNNNGAWDQAGTTDAPAIPAEPFALLTVTFGNSVIASPKTSTFPFKDANNPGSGEAPINVAVTSSGATPNIRYVVESGPDANATSTACQEVNSSPTTWVCDVENTTTNPDTGTPDGVRVFNDLNKNGVYDPATDTVEAEPSDTATVSFVAPTSITLTPKLAPGQSQPQVAVGGCQIYTLDVEPGVKFPARVTVTQSLGTAASAPAAALSTCSVPGGSAVTAGSSVTSSGGLPPLINPTWTDTLTVSGSTDQDPANPSHLVFGISSSKAGTVTLHSATTLTKDNAPSPNNQTLAVVTPGAAHTVSVTPTNPTIVAGSTEAFSVLVQDSAATPIPGAAVSYVVAAGDPDATSKAVTCQAADSFGQAKCSLTNNRNLGVDHVTFFAPQASGETAPAANDPQTTTNVTIEAAPPPGSTLTFGCPDELLTDANQIVPNCTVTTGDGSQRQIFFAAHVADASNTPLGNIPVTFKLVSAPNGSTGTATAVNTNANGNALFVVTVPSPAAGNKVTVQAKVGDPANGGLGPDNAVATFQAPHPAVVSVSPHSQKIAAGGIVNLTGRVTDQFGVGIAGQTLDYAVNGRNSRAGEVTTGSNGTASFSYVDTGASGSDTVSVLDVSPDAPSGAGSNNPATATVTFGSSGCTSGCTGGKKEKPALTVTQKVLRGGKAKLKLIVTSHPKLVQATVIFYQVSKSGTRHKIGRGLTGRRGKCRGTLKAAKGLHLRFQAKVKGRAGVRSGFSPVVKVHVK